MVFPIGSRRPTEMIIRSASLLVLPEPSILFKAIDRRRIRVTIVEISDLSFNSQAMATDSTVVGSS